MGLVGWLLEARAQGGVLGQEGEEAEEGEEGGQRAQVAAQHREKTRAEGTFQSRIGLYDEIIAHLQGYARC